MTTAMGTAVRTRLSAWSGEPVPPPILLEVILLASLRELHLTDTERGDIFAALETTKKNHSPQEGTW